MSDTKPSKSARKREQHALQALGERLIGLGTAQLEALELDATLKDAVLAARAMKAHGALRRQKQLVGKLMRRVDPAPIRAALDALDAGANADKAVFRDAEAWRDRIVAEGIPALGDFEAATGSPQPALGRELATLADAASPRATRTAKRRIFREIHRVLQDGAGSAAD